MTAILTAAQMRALERRAIDSGAVTGLELMERAGHGVVDAILARWPELAAEPASALVLCGPGNNGGDGFVVARLLRGRGWRVAVYLLGEPGRLPPDARANHDLWQRFGGVQALRSDLPDGWLSEALDRIRPEESRHCVVVDALFGIGLTRPLDGEGGFGRVLDAVRFAWEQTAADVLYVAVDVPSGLCAESGRILGQDFRTRVSAPAIKADLTVTFHAMKPGHLLSDGPKTCGQVEIVGIGLEGLPFGSPLSDRLAVVGDSPPFRLAKRTGHKYAHGHALLLSGGCGRGGAARLAARGALRVGAGLVTLAVPPAALQENAARLDAIMLRSVRDAEALAALLTDARLAALAAGPGLGTGEREAALLAALLDATGESRATVLDADALTLLSQDESLRARLHPRVVLTPHEGEFARLCPGIHARWRAPATRGPAFSKLDAAREAAAALGCVVLLKGPDTVIAEPAGRAAIHAAAYDRAAPWLATAGSGDVLTGLICGLLARGLPPFDAACTAAWLHVEAARSFGPGLIAEDLPEELPKVFRALGL